MEMEFYRHCLWKINPRSARLKQKVRNKKSLKRQEKEGTEKSTVSASVV